MPKVASLALNAERNQVGDQRYELEEPHEHGMHLGRRQMARNRSRMPGSHRTGHATSGLAQSPETDYACRLPTPEPRSARATHLE